MKITKESCVSEKEAQGYVEYIQKKYKRPIKTLDIKVDGNEAVLDYTFEPVKFERIRRITG